MKQFALCLSVANILLLNVMEVYGQKCACCACDPSVHLSVPSMGFVYVFVWRKFISSFKSLRAGSQMCALLMLCLCVILPTMW